MPHDAVPPGRLSGRPRTLTIWAGRLLTAVAAAHLAFFLATSTEFVPDWLSGALWADIPLDAPMPQAQAFFWQLVGSFAVPTALLGLLLSRFAREGRALPGYVTWTVAAWVTVCASTLEPSGFPVGLVPAAMLVTARLTANGASRRPEGAVRR
ncbi:MAG: hypothetical protein GEV28_02910 [Actinophytocola sp.]|uniref:DUF6463 family protein n=1 Tax=Actinophytocola sp. TaxID=1872138 RepID=UPI0013290549|nr:DUF6463 family protein [Actinophytocola sp.]MPZ79385.1 hypothetical protein [Actinophytocola sp.]